MQIASWLLVTSTLAAPTAPATTAQETAAITTRRAISFAAAEQQRRTIAPPPTTQFSPARTFGLGGVLSVSNRGIAGSTRYFFNKHIGAALTAGWVRPYALYQTYARANENPILTSSTVHVSPIAIYSFNETDQNREVSLRPFITAGAGYLHASRPGQNPQTAGYSYSGTSQYASFGSEIFFRDHPNFALSAEGIYYNIPSGFINRYYTDGMNYQISATFYLK